MRPLRWARPVAAEVILAALLLAPAPLLLQLNINNAPETYFPEDAPAVVFDDMVRERLPEDELLIALFEGDTLFTSDFLQRFHATATTLEQRDAVERVLSVTTADHIQATPGGFAVETLVNTNHLDRRSPEGWRDRALSDRFAPGMLIAPQGDALALVVRPHPLDNSMQRLQLEQAVRETISAQGLGSEVDAIAGHVALDVAQLRSMIRDNAVFIPLTTAIGLALLWLLFRRGLAIVLAFLSIAAVVNVAIACFVLAGRPYTLVSSIIPPLASALTVAMLMHLFTGIRHAAQRGHTGRARVQHALSAVRRPTLFTAITTAAGLASLGLSPIRPIRDFGLVAAIAVLVAAGVVLLIIPSLLERWDRGDWRGGRGLRWIDKLTRTLGALAIRRAGWVVAVSVALLIVGIPQIRHVMVETDFYTFFDEDHPLSVDTRLVESKLSGVMPLEVIFRADGRDSLLEPERLRAIDRVQAWLDDQPEVDYSLSMPDMVKQMHWAFNEERSAYFSIPDSRALVSQYLFVYDGKDLNDVVDGERELTRILLNLDAHGARELNAFIDRLRNYLASEPPADLEWGLAGMGRLFADQERLLFEGQMRSVAAAAALIFALMLILWRSFTAAALTMVPNLAPVVFIFILMGITGIWLDMATAMVASVAVGIAVDDTIHTYQGFACRRAMGSPVPWAIARTFRQAGRAVVGTTLVLCAQFLILTLSAFQPTATFGLLTAVGLIAALVFDLLLLPALLTLCRRMAARRSQQAT